MLVYWTTWSRAVIYTPPPIPVGLRLFQKVRLDSSRTNWIPVDSGWTNWIPVDSGRTNWNPVCPTGNAGLRAL